MKQVLVVDDDERVRNALKVMLEKAGYDTVLARNGGEAVKMYSEMAPPLVLMDILLPGQHGLDAIKEIIISDPDARIIAFSGMQQRSMVMAALDAGARDFIGKPFEIEELTVAIKKHMK